MKSLTSLIPKNSTTNDARGLKEEVYYLGKGYHTYIECQYVYNTFTKRMR